MNVRADLWAVTDRVTDRGALYSPFPVQYLIHAFYNSLRHYIHSFIHNHS